MSNSQSRQLYSIASFSAPNLLSGGNKVLAGIGASRIKIRPRSRSRHRPLPSVALPSELEAKVNLLPEQFDLSTPMASPRDTADGPAKEAGKIDLSLRPQPTNYCAWRASLVEEVIAASTSPDAALK